MWAPSLGGKIPRVWQPTAVFSPGRSHGHRSLVGYSPWSGPAEAAWHTCVMWDFNSSTRIEPGFDGGLLTTILPGNSLSFLCNLDF